MKIALCDDDKLLVDMLSIQVENLIDKNNLYNFSFEYHLFTDPLLLLSEHQKEPFDIAFLDIDMPQTDGLSLADKLFTTNNNVFIFYVTSYTQFIVPSIKHRVYRYILKDDIEEMEDSIKQMLSDLSILHARYRFKFKNQAYSLPYSSIFYIESQRNKIIIHTKGKTYEQLVTLKKIQSDLPKVFCRCHNGFIVNIANVEYMTKTDIFLIDGTQIPISKKYYKNVLSKMTP